MNPVSYAFIDDPHHQRSIGFLAQEVEEIFPELVQRIPDDRFGELLTLNYEGFSVLAVKAIQEQQQVIERQQATLDQQQTRLDKLEADLAEMRALLYAMQAERQEKK